MKDEMKRFTVADFEYDRCTRRFKFRGGDPTWKRAGVESVTKAVKIDGGSVKATLWLMLRALGILKKGL